MEGKSVEEEKKRMLNQIVAAGLNSLIDKQEEQLLESFISLSFDQILPCWEMLNPKIKFKIFQHHLTDFEEYMRGKAGWK